jgi:hypothetical protein
MTRRAALFGAQRNLDQRRRQPLGAHPKRGVVGGEGDALGLRHPGEAGLDRRRFSASAQGSPGLRT